MWSILTGAVQCDEAKGYNLIQQSEAGMFKYLLLSLIILFVNLLLVHLFHLIIGPSRAWSRISIAYRYKRTCCMLQCSKRKSIQKIIFRYLTLIEIFQKKYYESIKSVIKLVILLTEIINDQQILVRHYFIYS